MESSIIDRFSSRVVPSTWVTCAFQALPTTMTAGVSASSRARICGSSAAFPPGRRVEPKATSRACRSGSRRKRWKKSASLRLERGNPPSM